MTMQYPLWIGGQWRDGGETLTPRSPYNEEVIGSTSLAGEELVEEAIDAAEAARPQMGEMSSQERFRALDYVRGRMQEERSNLVRLVAMEAGKPVKQAAVEVDRAMLTIETAAEESKRLGGELLPLDLTSSTKGHFGIVRRFPIGPVLGISPFNFPLNLAMHKVASALAAGNPIVLKPATKTPLVWLYMARLFAEAELPAGALSVLLCSNDLTSRMVEDDRFKMVSFTGSVPVGWALKTKAGKKKVALELGGNAATIVDSTADLGAAAPKLAISAFGYAGQSCISTQRIFVMREIAAEFTEQLLAATRSLKVGDPLDPETDVGPMIEPSAVRRTQEWIAEALEMGGHLLTGGDVDGNIVQPTVISHVPEEARVCSQEVFAPVVVVSTCSNFDEAVHRVNDSQYGLQASVFTRDLQHAFQAHRELEVGGVIVNEASSYRVDSMPYGGVKDSGLGREGVRYAMEEMTEPRILVVGGLT